MNLKTTFLLVLLVAAGAAGWVIYTAQTPTAAKSSTLRFLEESLQPASLTRITLAKGNDTRYTLERNGAEWSLPGRWPVRTQDVDHIVQVLTGLRSRFAPVPVAKDADLSEYGLGDGALTVKIKLGDKEHTLVLGEQPDKDNRFTRATFLRLDDQPEVVRLGPGIIAELDRPQEYLQQRRLFPPERVAKDEDSKEKVEQVQAQEIRVEGPDGKFTLVKQGNDWTISEPTADRTDPEKLKTLLAGLPDFWADRFVEQKDKKLADFGLDNPEYAFTVTRPGGAAVKLLVGKVSDTKERVIMRPGPPNQFGMPPKQIPQFLKEEYRFAKLENKAQGRRGEARRAARPAARPLQDRRRSPRGNPATEGNAGAGQGQGEMEIREAGDARRRITADHGVARQAQRPARDGEGPSRQCRSEGGGPRQAGCRREALVGRIQGGRQGKEAAHGCVRDRQT
jgi:Domain of unknown function (DUF4340)